MTGWLRAVFFLIFGFSTDHWHGFAEALRFSRDDP